MLQNKVDSERYKAEFIKKFSNFCEKSPVLLSFVMTDTGASVIHANTGKRYEFPWDYSTPVKYFIHSIKEVLVNNHYPRMVETVVSDTPLTAEEQASYFERGEEIPLTKRETRQRVWRIDRVIVFKDIFILVDEETGEQYRYKLNKSCVFFLKNYRSGKYSLESAWEYFVKNSVLLNKLEKINEQKGQ